MIRTLCRTGILRNPVLSPRRLYSSSNLDTTTKTPLQTMLVLSQQLASSSPTIKIAAWPNINLRIRPNDILDPNDVLNLRASFVCSASGDGDKPVPPANTPPLRLTVTDDGIELHADVDTAAQQDDSDSDDEEQPNTDCRSPAPPTLTCLLEVPVQSSLDITSAGCIDVERLYSDRIDLCTTSSVAHVRTRSLNSIEHIRVQAIGGADIRCEGNTLSHRIDIQARATGSVHVAKAQGDELHVRCEAGTISTDACYSEQSEFVAGWAGKLKLRNVHKRCALTAEQDGRVEVSGFHGHLTARLYGDDASGSFQLTEVYGQSSIESPDGAALTVNVSDFVLENAAVEVATSAEGRIELDEKLAAEFAEHLLPGGQRFEHEPPLSNALVVGGDGADADRLSVRSEGGPIRLGKMSWTDTLMLKLNATRDQ